MSETVIIIIFAIYVLVSFIISVIDIAGASFYDIQMMKRLRDRQKHPHAGRYTKRPMVSIIIPTFNEEKVIERCLNSLTQSDYRKYEIIVADDGSKDNTKKIVRKFIKGHKMTGKIKLVSDGQNRGRGGAINQGFKKSKGELIMAIDADCTVEPDSVRNAALHFADDKVMAMAANVKIMPHLSILGLLQQFEYVTSFRSKKFNSFANAEYIVGGAGATYRRSILEKLGGFDETKLTEDIDLSLRIALSGNKQNIMQYGSDVVVMTEHVPTYKSLFNQRFRWKLGSLQALYTSKQLFWSRNKEYSKTLTWFRLPMVLWGETMLLLEPLVLSFFVYLAIAQQTPIMFIVSWAALMVTLFFAIWGDDMLSTAQKLRFTIFMPIMYLLYYILSFIQIIAMFKAIKNHRKIRGKIKIRGNWTSPERLAS